MRKSAILALLLAACGDEMTELENTPPNAVGSIPDLEAYPGDTAQLDLKNFFADEDGDTLTYDASSSNGMIVSVQVAGTVLRGTAGRERGEATVTVTAKDPDGASATQELTVTVGNRPPNAVGSIPDLEAYPGDSAQVDLRIFFADEDGDTLTYDASSSNEMVVSVEVAGTVLMGTAGRERGEATVTVTAMDPGGASATHELTVTVGNRPPASQPIPAQSLDQEMEVSINLEDHFSDPDNDVLMYEASEVDEELIEVEISGSTMTISSGTQPGTTSFRITATDEAEESVTETVEVTVSGVAAQIFDEQFDSLSPEWRERWLDAAVEEGILILDNEQEADSFPRIPHIYHAVDRAEDWTVTWRQGSDEDWFLYGSMMVFTGDADYPAWSVDTDFEYDDLEVYVYSSDADSWSLIHSDYEYSMPDGGWVTFALSLEDGRLALTADDGDVFGIIPEMPNGGDAPPAVTGIGPGFYTWDEIEPDAYTPFDWIEVEGVVTTSPPYPTADHPSLNLSTCLGRELTCRGQGKKGLRDTRTPRGVSGPIKK